MDRSLRAVVLISLMLLLASAAHAQYTTATIAACPNDGVPGVCVVFSGTNVKSTEPEANRYTPRSAAELAEMTAARKRALNGLDMTQKALSIGTVVADPATGPPSPISDDTDVAAFAALVETCRLALAKKAVLLATQTDVDAAMGALSAPYLAAKGPVRARLDGLLMVFFRGAF